MYQRPIYRRIFKPLLILAAAAALACVTINVYFPEAEVKDISEQIEAAILKRAAEAEAAEGGGASGGHAAASLVPERQAPERPSLFEIALGTALYYGLGASPAYAEEDKVAAPEISNPAIRKIIQSRSARVRQLNGFKAQGAIGENNRALVDVRDLNALPLQQRAAVQKLVREENADRERMFKEIAAATGTDLSQLPRIQQTYAETLRTNARPGDWIQMPDGAWRQK